MKENLNAKKDRKGGGRGSSALLYVLTIVLTLFVYIFHGINSLPDRLYIRAGQEELVCSELPFEASYEPEAVTAMSSGDEAISGSGLTGSSGDGSEMELSFLGFEVKKIDVSVVPDDLEVVPCGKTVGVYINSSGVTVLGMGTVTSKDGKNSKPAEGVVMTGDNILKIDGGEINSTDELKAALKQSDGELDLEIQRNGELIETKITPALNEEDAPSLGIYARNGTQGIGTLTYYNPDNRKFGALGHGILDVDTKQLVHIRDGRLLNSEVSSIRKGRNGSPGELIGQMDKETTLGSIKLNTPLGLYGFVNGGSGLPPESEAMPIALQSEVKTGPAKIRSNVSGTEIREYDVYIESTNKYSSDESKGLVLRITDKDLLSQTNGIVQGMSGSPIIQDGRLIGAVTHVFVKNPAKGYGIFIENMLKQEGQI